MQFAKVPSIAVSPAPLQLPSSPPSILASVSSIDEDQYVRALFLSPPPFLSPRQAVTRCSPCNHPSEPLPFRGIGMERERFENLLKASRDRNLLVLGKKGLDLRKEVALKVHRGKQEERRARFLAKIGAPPSPTATNLPVTPPESPALFHFTLPSPGLVSPLALFEALGSEVGIEGASTSCWVEQVDFHLPKEAQLAATPFQRHRNFRRRSLPSLEEISSHLKLDRPVVRPDRPRAPLPAFLNDHKDHSSVEISFGDHVPSAPSVKRPAVCHSPTPVRPDLSEPALHITTSVVPRTATTSPTALTEANLLAFEQRARASRGLSTLRRRVSPDINMGSNDDKRGRRFSAPPQLFHHDEGRINGGF